VHMQRKRSPLRIIPRLAATAMLLLLTGMAAAAEAPGATVSITIDWHPEQDQPENALWLAYLMARAAYIKDHRAAYDWKPGVVTASFAEELAARTSAAGIYRGLQSKDAHLNVPYFEDLARVADNSFLGEYVWTYLHQAEWGSPPAGLHLVDFMHWRADHLTGHAVITEGGIRFVADRETSVASARAPASEVSTLVQGRTVLEHGDPQMAIAGYFDPVIEHFDRSYRDSGKRIYAARNSVQMILYAALPNDDKKPVEVLDSTWSDAYLMKAYALTELRRVADAQGTLEKAISLSPMTSQYLSELAYTYQAQGRCDLSIASYANAESAAEMGSDESTRTTDLTRAWRGQAYCLVEQGRLDDAEKLYQKCLALDPSDAKAKAELQYIKSKRGR
jgi:tetratricopeptide (TPR) repeat protein